MRHLHVGLALLLLASVARSQDITVTHDANSPVQPGDVINITAKAPAGATGTFQIEGLKRNYPLVEGPAGWYTSDFTVRRGEVVNDRRLSATFQLRDGQVLRAEAPNRIGTTPPPTTPTVAPTASDLTVVKSEIKPTTWVKAGDTISMGVVATPQSTVTVTAVGLFRDVKLEESRAGNYMGSWVVPRQPDLTISQPTFFVKVTKDTRTLIVPFNGTVMVDTAPPTIIAVTPADQDVYTTSLKQITVVYTDRDGSNQDKSKLRINLDGTDVAVTAAESNGVITCALPRALSVGRHQLSVTLVDLVGNKSEPVNSTFNIIPGTTALDISHDATADLQPGDSFGVRLNAQTGGRASFTIGTVVVDSPMAEVAAGHYEGSYTLRRNDKLAGLTVVITYVAPDGTRQQIRSNVRGAAPGRTPAATGVLAAPVITAPTAGATVTQPTALRGTATPGAKVEITIDSLAVVAGFMEMRGDTIRLTATVNGDGQWATAPVTFERPALAGKTTFTIVAVTTQNDKRSEPTTIKVER